MNKEFGKTITRLRKKKGLSQKEVCEKLGISQSLLSHYEKGIRECGLEFLYKTADLYDVSVDYLLGRTANPGGADSDARFIPDVDEVEDVNRIRSNTYCMINRKLLVNSTAVIYSLLSEINNKKLSKFVSDYLSVAEYNIFRKIYSLNENDDADIFSIDACSADDYCNALLNLNNAKINEIKSRIHFEGIEISDDILSEKYSDSYPSLNQMIKNAEKTLSHNFKL